MAFDAWIGLIAAALLLWSAAFRTLATQAMTDVFYLFFLLCGCLAIVVFSKTKNEKRAVFITAICGLLAGLACSVKITGLVIVGATFLLALMQRYGFRVWRRWKETLGMAGIFSCCALLTVYALNPYFWPSWKDIQAKSVPHEMRMMLEESIATKSIHVKGRYPDLRELARPLEFPRMFRRWKDLMRGQQSISEWKHDRLVDIHARLASNRLNPPGEFIFVGIGVVALLWKRCSRYLPAPDRSQTIPLFYFFVNYFFIVLFIQLNWIRYYVPTMVAAHLIAAVGVYALLSYSHQALPRMVKWGTLARHGGPSEAPVGE
jgi:4-amino-4-deoxy-L-arabinose transferase-like glycosyltransferase